MSAFDPERGVVDGVPKQHQTPLDEAGSFGLMSWAAAVLAIAFAALCMQWQIIDHAPPEWDEAMYLIDALDEFQGAKTGGLAGFYSAFLSTNPGRVGLLALIAQPGFWIFGPSADAAIAPFALFCLLAVWALYDFTRNLARHCLAFAERQSTLAGFAAALLFVLYPATEYQSNKFLTEFPLIASMALLHAAALRYFLSGRIRWALVVGLAVSAGLLAKITFPALAIVPAILIVARWWTIRDWRAAVVGALVIIAPPMLIVGPFFIRNLSAIIEQTRYLSSAQLAGVYGFGGALDWRRSFSFIWALLHQYEFLLLNALAILAVVRFLLLRKASTNWLSLLAAGYLAPLLIVAFSNFKIERYAYPGYTPLFCLAALGLMPLCRHRQRLAVWILAALLVAPGIKFATAYNFLPASAMSLVDWTYQHSAANERYSYLLTQPAPRNDITDLVRAVDEHAGPGPVILLGGASDFHGALLRFESRSRGVDRIYTTFSTPMTEGPDAVQKMQVFIKDVSPAALLYKTAPYNPEFLGNNVPELMTALREGGGYRRIDLQMTQPNGSRFALLIPDEAVPGSARVVTPASAASPEDMPLRYGSTYESSRPRFEKMGKDLGVSMTFFRTGPPLDGEAIFFHILDDKGNIIGNLDRVFCQKCDAAVQRREHRFVIQAELLAKAKSIGFGVYSTKPPNQLLDVQGGISDWGGRRILVEIPNRP